MAEADNSYGLAVRLSKAMGGRKTEDIEDSDSAVFQPVSGLDISIGKSARNQAAARGSSRRRATDETISLRLNAPLSSPMSGLELGRRPLNVSLSGR